MTQAPLPSSLWEIAFVIGTMGIFVGAGLTALWAAGWLLVQVVSIAIPQAVVEVGGLIFDVVVYATAGAIAVCVAVAVLTWATAFVYRLRRGGGA